MKSPVVLVVALTLVAGCLGAGASRAQARIGETQEEFERRLLQPFVGKFIPRDKNPDPARDEALRLEQPFNEARIYFPADIKERKYWKSAVAQQLSNENGWKLHVFFSENRSVLEAYQRVGEELSEFEVTTILNASQGDSKWVKTTDDSGATGAAPSALGYDYERADGKQRARVRGAWLMVYSTEFDRVLQGQRRAAEASAAVEAEERRKDRQKRAPETTAGF